MSSTWLLLALGLDGLLGDPRIHPVVAIGWVIHRLERGLTSRCGRTRLAGVLLVGLTLMITMVSIQVVLFLIEWISLQGRQMLVLILAWLLVAMRSLHRQSRTVLVCLEAGDCEGARKALGMIVGRDTARLDEEGILRAMVETVAENTSDGIVAPLFYFWIFGPLGMVAYKTVNTLDSMVGYRNETYGKVGWAAARLDDLANLLPARLTACLFVVLAPLWKGSFRRALRILWRDRRAHPSPNAGWPEAAVAGALGIKLGGPSWYGGKLCDKPTLGDSLQPIDRFCYRNVIGFMYGATVLFLLLTFLGDWVVGR